METDPIIAAVKGLSDLQQAHRKDGLLYLGSIDVYTAQNWAKECRHAVGTKEWKEYALAKLRSSDYAEFRAQQVKRYI